MRSSTDGTIAYWVGVQCSAVRMKGQDCAIPMDLRVMEIFRREGGQWKLIHRHAERMAADSGAWQSARHNNQGSQLNAVTYAVNPSIAESALNNLFTRVWGEPVHASYARVLARSLVYVAAFAGDQLVGFANVATDGGVHAFILDPTVDPAFQRRGIGTELVQLAAREAGLRGCEWLHVDYEPHLAPFYSAAGFRSTTAGVMRLDCADGRLPV